MTIKIPFLGDGIESANVVCVLVKPGDAVSVDQTVLELETDKATAPVPSTTNGVVQTIHVNEGDLVKQGMVVITLDGNGDDASAPPSPPVASTTSAPTPPVPTVAPVGAAPYTMTTDLSQVHTTPSILKFARLSGLDLGRIAGSGRGGRIVWDDVHQYVSYVQATAFSSTDTPSPSAKPKKPPVDFSSFGPIETKPVSSLRQKISDHLSDAWTTIPHVTQFGDIQMNPIMALRRSVNASLPEDAIKLSVTVFVLKAIAQTLSSFEIFNSSLVDGELIIKQYIHLGVAVDTPAGLVVPVIRDVDKKSLADIALELDELAQKARNKALALSDIQGATFTLSNLGGLGASHFTPIVNSPEVAILGTGRARAVVSLDDDGQVVNRLMMPVALSYDHRVIDGADGARFMQALTENIESFNEEWVN